MKYNMYRLKFLNYKMGNDSIIDPPKKLPTRMFETSKLKKAFKKKPKQESPNHEYFTAHKCYLTPEKVNAHQIKCSRLRKCFLNWTSVHMGDIRAANLYRSYSALCAEKYRQYKYHPLSIHPFCKLRVWLEVVVIISVLCGSILLAGDVSLADPRRVNIFIAVNLLFCECVYLINIIMNFFTGYVEGDTCQYVILDLKKISCRYLRSWLLLDFFSTLNLISLFIDLHGQFYVFWFLFLQSIKLFRIPNMLRYLNNVLTVSRIGILGKTIIEIFVLIVTYLSWNMYFQFASEYMKEGSCLPKNPDACSWISMAKLWNETSSIRIAYTFDRAVGMLRKNSNINLVEKKGCYENFFIVAWIIGKLIVYHGVFKYIASLFGKESAKGKYFIMTKQVATLMNRKKYPPRIKEKILKFYAIRFQSHYFAETKMLSCVTGQLREDIIMHTGRRLVGELEFLKHLPRALLLQIVLKLKIVIFIAGDIIFKINTVGDCLYFIDKGTVAIYSESGNEICHLEDGDYFGEIALVMKHSIRTASAVAVTNCELFRLDKEDFDGSIACYPTVYENIKKVAINRYERTCVLDEHHKAEMKMAEDHYMKGFADSSLERELGSVDRM